MAPAIAPTKAAEAVTTSASTEFAMPPSDAVRTDASSEEGLDADGKHDVEKRGDSDTDGTKYPGPKQTFIVMIAILLALFLMALDRTIVVTAIPQITNDFNSLDDVGWYGSAFLFTACAFQLPLGRIYTFYPPKWVFLSLIMLFEIGSVVCGAAPTSVALIVGRAIAGIGAAGMMSGAIILMISVLPLHKRPLYMGAFGAVFGIASIIGPLVGGALTTDVSWRWCFYINLPIGGAAIAIIFFILRPTPPAKPNLTWRQKVAQVDPLGELFLLPSIICLLLALQWGGVTYPWSNGRIVALMVVFAITLLAFIFVQIWRPDTATVAPRIFKNRSMVSAQFFTFCLASAMMTMFYYVPFWFQAIRGNTAVRSGINTLPMLLSVITGSIGAGGLVRRFGYYTPLAIASSCIMPIGAGLIYTWKVDTAIGYWIGYQILFGLGIGAGMQQGAMTAQCVLAKEDVPTGVSLMFFWQQLGGSVFVSVGQNVIQTSLVKGLSKVVPNLDPVAIANTGATNIQNMVQDPEDLAKVLVAYNAALQQAYMAALIVACVSALGSFSLEWKSVKGKANPFAEDKPSASDMNKTEGGQSAASAAEMKEEKA